MGLKQIKKMEEKKPSLAVRVIVTRRRAVYSTYILSMGSGQPIPETHIDLQNFALYNPPCPSWTQIRLYGDYLLQRQCHTYYFNQSISIFNIKKPNGKM